MPDFDTAEALKIRQQMIDAAAEADYQEILAAAYGTPCPADADLPATLEPLQTDGSNNGGPLPEDDLPPQYDAPVMRSPLF